MQTPPQIAFDAYELGLIAFAAQADLLTTVAPTQTRTWQDSFTAQMVTALTETAAELRERAFPAGADADDIDADSIRESIIERICDDVLCELSPAYDVGEHPDTGAPILEPATAAKAQ